MVRLPSFAQSLGLVLLTATTSITVAALDFDTCADFNTASMARNISNFQTNGLCHDFCIQEYAYAITQDTSCWCSNYAPAQDNVVDDDRCSEPCPAYPSERCGGPDVFGYLILNDVLPSGTSGAPSSTTQTSDQSDTTTPPPSSTHFSTITDGGSVRTVTVGPSPDPDSGNSGGSSDDGGMSTGAIVGIVIGVILAVLIGAGAALFWFFRRRKRSQQEEGFHEDPSLRSSSVGVGSSSTRPEMGGAAGTPLSGNSGARRNSTLQIDPRMDPFKQGLYVRSGSRESINTIRDDHDYSRKIQQPKVLRATNPDPVANE